MIRSYRKSIRNTLQKKRRSTRYWILLQNLLTIHISECHKLFLINTSRDKICKSRKQKACRMTQRQTNSRMRYNIFAHLQIRIFGFKFQQIQYKCQIFYHNFSSNWTKRCSLVSSSNWSTWAKIWRRYHSKTSLWDWWVSNHLDII